MVWAASGPGQTPPPPPPAVTGLRPHRPSETLRGPTGSPCPAPAPASQCWLRLLTAVGPPWAPGTLSFQDCPSLRWGDDSLRQLWSDTGHAEARPLPPVRGSCLGPLSPEAVNGGGLGGCPLSPTTPSWASGTLCPRCLPLRLAGWAPPRHLPAALAPGRGLSPRPARLPAAAPHQACCRLCGLSGDGAPPSPMSRGGGAGLPPRGPGACGGAWDSGIQDAPHVHRLRLRTAADRSLGPAPPDAPLPRAPVSWPGGGACLVGARAAGVRALPEPAFRRRPQPLPGPDSCHCPSALTRATSRTGLGLPDPDPDWLPSGWAPTLPPVPGQGCAGRLPRRVGPGVQQGQAPGGSRWGCQLRLCAVSPNPAKCARSRSGSSSSWWGSGLASPGAP